MKKLMVAAILVCAGGLALSVQSITAQDQKKDDVQKEVVIGTIERFDPRFDKLIPPGAKVVQITNSAKRAKSTVAMGVAKDGFEETPTKYIWTEGVVWYKPQNILLFSDIPNNAIIGWKEGQAAQEFIKPSGYTGEKPRGGKPGDEPGSNGLFVDAKNRLYLAEHGDRRISRIDPDGKKTVLADKYDGKRLNSPNDLAVHPNGDVYFTDPTFGLGKGDMRELTFTGVFRINAKDGKVSLVSDKLSSPNGIALSPDAKTLYATGGNSWWAFPVNEDGSTGEGKVFTNTSKWPTKVGGGLDGMDVDSQGNIFATVSNGLAVMAPDGTLLGIFRTGDRTANLCFGGEDGSTLFICINQRIGMVKTTTKGVGW